MPNFKKRIIRDQIERPKNMSLKRHISSQESYVEKCVDEEEKFKSQ